MITVTYRDKSTKQLSDEDLPRFLVELAGGGWTESQTRKSIELNHALFDHGKVRYKGVTMERTC